MFGTTASKFAASVILVAATAGGPAAIEKSTLSGMKPSHELPVAPAKDSLLVATLASGETQMQWMPRDACEQVEAAVAAGNGVAGVRSDGVRITIARANCSTPRVAADPSVLKLTTSELPH